MSVGLAAIAYMQQCDVSIVVYVIPLIQVTRLRYSVCANRLIRCEIVGRNDSEHNNDRIYFYSLQNYSLAMRGIVDFKYFLSSMLWSFEYI